MALQRVNGELPFTAPKIRRSERPVPLPAVCIDDSAGTVNARRGTPVEPRNLNRHFYPILERLGPDVRFLDLRHACVTLLPGLGIPSHVVRDIVVHSALDVTMSIYAHADMTEKRAALDKLGDLLSGG